MVQVKVLGGLNEASHEIYELTGVNLDRQGAECEEH